MFWLLFFTVLNTFALRFSFSFLPSSLSFSYCSYRRSATALAKKKTTFKNETTVSFPLVSYNISAFPSACKSYTSYLKSITPHMNEPQLVDIIPIYKDSTLFIRVLFNVGHLARYTRLVRYVLTFKGKQYYNTLNYKVPKHMVTIILRYIIPTHQSYKQGDVIHFSIINKQLKKQFPDLMACVKVPAVHNAPLATCSYVSNYNSLNELRSFVAFQLIQNVSLVIFYLSTPVPGIFEAFSKLIASNYLLLVDYTWPRSPIKQLLQRSNQQSQSNACFYRFRYDVEAMMIVDIDEYVYSEMYPSNLPAVIHSISQIPGKYDVFAVCDECKSNVDAIIHLYK